MSLTNYNVLWRSLVPSMKSRGFVVSGAGFLLNKVQDCSFSRFWTFFNRKKLCTKKDSLLSCIQILEWTPKIAAHHHHHYHLFAFCPSSETVTSRLPSTPPVGFISATHSHPQSDPTLERGRSASVSQYLRRGCSWGGLPSANQLVRGKEGLNEGNDPRAITAERSTLNIGILVWNKWKEFFWGGLRVAQPGPDVSFCQTTALVVWHSGSSNSIVIIHVLRPCEGMRVWKMASSKIWVERFHFWLSLSLSIFEPVPLLWFCQRTRGLPNLWTRSSFTLALLDS